MGMKLLTLKNDRINFLFFFREKSQVSNIIYPLKKNNNHNIILNDLLILFCSYFVIFSK